LTSVSGVLLRSVQRGTCVARWVCRQVRMLMDTTGCTGAQRYNIASILPIIQNRPIIQNIIGLLLCVYYIIYIGLRDDRMNKLIKEREFYERFNFY